jgi:hypothetical protein
MQTDFTQTDKLNELARQSRMQAACAAQAIDLLLQEWKMNWE